MRPCSAGSDAPRPPAPSRLRDMASARVNRAGRAVIRQSGPCRRAPHFRADRGERARRSNDGTAGRERHDARTARRSAQRVAATGGAPGAVRFYWQAPADVDAGYAKFAAYYRANYLPHLPADRAARILVVSCGPAIWSACCGRRATPTYVASIPIRRRSPTRAGASCARRRTPSLSRAESRALRRHRPRAGAEPSDT